MSEVLGEKYSLRALGIDFGERRIGVAISGANGRLVVPHSVIERSTDRRAAYQIAALAREEEAVLIVLGEPRGLDGSIGENVERVRRFGARLEKASGLPVHFVNEALTTVAAAERLSDAGLDRRDRQELRDAVAAQILLQEFIDQHLPEGADAIEGAE